VKAPVRFISYEPMLGSLERCTGTFLRRMFKTVNWIIRGPETPTANTLPRWTWLQEVEKAANAGVPIYMKHSMSEVYPDLVLRDDFP
jgi:protein gp37